MEQNIINERKSVTPDGERIYYCKKADIYCRLCKCKNKKTFCGYYVEQGLEEHSINVDSLKKCPIVFKKLWERKYGR